MTRVGDSPKSFDVICVGDATWKLARPGAEGKLRLRPSSGAVNVALRLRKHGMRVGLSTVLSDDAAGRAALDAIAASRVDIAGVTLAPTRASLVVIDARGDASLLARDLEARPALEVPESWSAKLVVLSGLSPVVAHAAALCKVARRARRDGSLVLLDFNASLHAWTGRDARTIRMVLREVDVARCSLADLAVLGMDVADVRAALRSSATVVVEEPSGRVTATGPFGEVVVMPNDAETIGARATTGDATMAAICRELARPRDRGESVSAAWHRALLRGRSEC